ncbi:MAG TPA: preprotein translocase subunit SecG [Chitinophagaceae bacterium]|jgi:preprotein translocase subunit SecG|nr:preprotein translocase subunit SecG [Chitinophagaceae bacterium]HMU58276.1 preprotein translocase subunit SecG [Chitinophagaceae bacterium]
MNLLFVILIIVACVVLGLIVLVQNPKGGGLSGNIAGFSNQFMGVKQTTDVLEKGTWIFGGVVALLCMISVMFINRTTEKTIDIKGAPTSTQTAPAPGTLNTTPANTAPATPAPAQQQPPK